MKAILEFNLDEREDDQALKRCHKSLAMAMVLFDFAYNSRKGIEYELEGREDMDAFGAVELCFKRFFELLDEHSIIIDDLIE